MTGGSLREALSSFVDPSGIPGIVALVARRDGSEELAVLGVRSREKAEPVTPDTIFRISSVTKPIVAVAAMILVDDGRLALDEPVARWLPELAHPKVLTRLDASLADTVAARRPITVRDVLTFRIGSGMILAPPGAYPIQAAMLARLGSGMPAPASLLPADEWLAAFASLPLMHQPGDRWRYNTSAYVLGILVARAAGQPLERFLEERLFGPLGMKDTGFHVPPAKLARFTDCYLGNDAGAAPALYDAVEGQWSRPPAHASGADGLVSTAPDLLRFSRLLLGLRDEDVVDGVRLLSEESIRAMTTNALTPENGKDAFVPGFFDTHGWGYGMCVVTAPDPLGLPAGSFGWDGGLGSSWYADPRTGTTGVLLSNTSWTNPSPPPLFHAFWRYVHRRGDER